MKQKIKINKKELQKFTQDNIKELSLMSWHCFKNGISVDELEEILQKITDKRKESLKQNPK